MASHGIQRGQYVLFRLETTHGSKPLRLFLTRDRTWTQVFAHAQKGTFATMKALMARMRVEYPGIILEECRD